MTSCGCRACGGAVEPVARALTCKIVSRDSTEFFCLACLAEKFGTTREALLETAERYRRQGCVLFRRPHAANRG